MFLQLKVFLYVAKLTQHTEFFYDGMSKRLSSLSQVNIFKELMLVGVALKEK